MRQIDTFELRSSASILFIEDKTEGLPWESLFPSKIVPCSHVPTVFLICFLFYICAYKLSPPSTSTFICSCAPYNSCMFPCSLWFCPLFPSSLKMSAYTQIETHQQNPALKGYPLDRRALHFRVNGWWLKSWAPPLRNVVWIVDDFLAEHKVLRKWFL